MALEQFANAPIPSSPSTAWTTLSAPIDAVTTTIPVVGFAMFPSAVQFRILIDDEYFLVTAGAGSTSWTATRAVEGSIAAVHAAGASVYHILTAASLARSPGPMTTLGDMVYLGAAGAPTRLAAPADGDYVTRWATGVPVWTSIAGAGLLTAAAATATYQPIGAYVVGPSPSITNLTLPLTVNASTGIVFKTTLPFLHDYAAVGSSAHNTFLGRNAGNFTMSPGGGAAYLASYNTVVGADAFTANTTGWNNTAVGALALAANTTGVEHAAFGMQALAANTIGNANSAFGRYALRACTTGSHNVSVGYMALYSATTQGDNTAVGSGALYAAVPSGGTGGDVNVAVGSSALHDLTSGYGNTAVGYQAGWGDGVTNVNNRSLTDYDCTFVGMYASRDATVAQATTLINAMALGYAAVVDASHKIVFGNDLITTFQLGSPGTITTSKVFAVGPVVGANLVGSDLTFRPGVGTGTGGSGKLIVSMAPPAASGSTPNTPVSVMTVDNLGNLGIGTATAIARVHIVGAVGFSPLLVVGATQTASFPVLDLTQTWNNAGATFTGIKLNITSTLSAAASLLLDLQVGAVSQFSVTKAGAVAGASLALSQANLGTTSADGLVLDNATLSTSGVPVQMSPRIRLRSHVWNTTATAADNTNDWWIEAIPTSAAIPAGLLRFGSSLNGAAVTYPFSIRSINTNGNPASAIFTRWENVADSNSALYWQASNSLQLNATNWYSNASLRLRSDLAYSWSNSSSDPSQSADLFLLRDAANVLAQRNGTNAQRLRVQNTFTTLETAGEWFSIDWITTANRCILSTVKGSVSGTLRGMTIGASASVPLSVYGVTPIVQPVLATGAAHTVDDVITALQNFGLVRQS